MKRAFLSARAPRGYSCDMDAAKTFRGLVILAAAAAAAPAGARAQSALALPELLRTAESASLGDGGALMRGLSAVGINPSGVHIRRAEVAAQYQSLPLQTQATMIGAAVPVKPFGATLAVNYLGLQSAGLEGRNELGEQQGSFTDTEQLIAVSAARPLYIGSNPDTGVTLGATMKWMRVQIAGTSAQSTAFDLGARYAMQRLPLSVGFSMINLGRGPKLADEASPLPVGYVFAAAARVAPGLALVGNLSRRPNEERTDLSFGLQYMLAGAVAVRGRYGMARGASGVSALGAFSGGIGLNILNGKTIDYAFQPFDSALRQVAGAGAHRMTLTLRFGKDAALEKHEDVFSRRRGEYLIGTW